MSYVVNWRAGDGTEGWHATADLPEAAAQVEHLRNSADVDGARIFRLEEVPFELRSYFRVELAVDPPAAPAPSPADTAGPAESSWAEPARPEAPEAGDAAETMAEAPEAGDTAATMAEAAVTEPVPPEPVLEAVADGPTGQHRRGLFGR